MKGGAFPLALQPLVLSKISLDGLNHSYLHHLVVNTNVVVGVAIIEIDKSDKTKSPDHSGRGFCTALI
jgi:hypothetical protein